MQFGVPVEVRGLRAESGVPKNCQEASCSSPHAWLFIHSRAGGGGDCSWSGTFVLTSSQESDTYKPDANLQRKLETPQRPNSLVDMVSMIHLGDAATQKPDSNQKIA